MKHHCCYIFLMLWCYWRTVRSFSIISTKRIASWNNRAAASRQGGFRRLLSSVDNNNNNNNDNDDTIFWTTDRVRSQFIDYFRDRHEHEYIPSAPCVPRDDPTLLFTNAGMNPFKSIFLGQVDPKSPLSKIDKAVNSQKCIRAGGKHNDLDDVGRDTYHHTFFEMLGSWSFRGTYFKKHAIMFAWELLTDVYKLDQDRLYATYFKGNDQVPADDQAKKEWLNYLPESRVIACDAKDNFWEMGDTGPCGPCTEIHYDRIGNRDASALVNADDPDVIEIWNLVFVQYNRDVEGDLQLLPENHVDTGMGLERLTSILQNKSSNYDIDIFRPIFEKIAEFSKVGKYGGAVEGGSRDDVLRDTAYRAIADHARALAFAIADGALPSNEGRGYVLRRILRRAARYGNVLQAPPGFFVELLPVVIDVFEQAYPELRKQQELMTNVVRDEEKAFGSMLERGLVYFDDLERELKKESKTTITGEQAFYLYDTLGFPVDLTELMAEEAGLSVDVEGFEKAMEEQRERSRRARREAKNSDNIFLELQAEQTSWLAKNDILPTDDFFKYKWNVELPATVMAIFTPDNGFVDEAMPGDYVGIVLDKSSFYAEAGGQEADTGMLTLINDDDDSSLFVQIQDVQTFAGYLLHTGRIVGDDSLHVGTPVSARVDYQRREYIAPNHSMTHVLNAALRKFLGDDVDQRGSLCNDEKLRFDFAFGGGALKTKQLEQIEEYCRNVITQAQPLSSKIMPLKQARELPNVRAVFGEVYPDPVRVVTIGNEETSVEFCGGTHLENTAQAQAFALIEETAVAKGIRRITAVTKTAAVEAIETGTTFTRRVEELENEDDTAPQLDKMAGALRKELDAAIMSAPLKMSLRDRIQIVQKRASEAQKAAVQRRVDRCIENVKQQIADSSSSFVVLRVDEIRADSKASQKITNAVKKAAPDMAFMGLSMDDDNKLLAFALVPENLRGLKADEWVRAALECCGGRGGGKPNSAQGQAKECSDVDEVLEAAQAFAASKLETQVM